MWPTSRELRAISHSDRKSDQVDAEKLARYARLDPNVLRPISHRTVEQQEALTLIRARDLLVRLRTAAVNAVRGLTKSCGYPTTAWEGLGTLTVGLHLAERGGKQAMNKAVVAVARRLAVLLHHIWVHRNLTRRSTLKFLEI